MVLIYISRYLLCDAVICGFLAGQPKISQLAQKIWNYLILIDLEEWINNGRWICFSIIEDRNSDDESEVEPYDRTVRPWTEKIKSVKTLRETDAPKQNNPLDGNKGN
ncbi:hypothetical protein Tco_0964653 [Tanacetum coccineum]